ncbi:MAG: polysaccharide pyruvyl transferase family protein [Chloroflexota bacterium]
MDVIGALKKLHQTGREKPWPLEKPIVVQFPVNDICNSRCQMCNIWQKKLNHQISPEELAHIAANDLFSEVRAIGINGGEPTLRKDLAELVETLYQKMPSLKAISLITNAYQDKVVIKRIQEMGEIVQKHDGYFEVMVSLDGVGDVHDLVRGKKGNFAKAVNVIDYIQDSELVHNGRLGCTVIRDNVYDLHNLLEFAISKEIYIKYRIGIPHQRLYSQDVVDPFALTFEEVFHFVVFLENLMMHYEESSEQNLFYQSLIDQLIYGKKRAAGCDWQHRGVTLSARGELLYCAVQSKTLGDARTADAKTLYFDNEDHLQEIIRTECDNCLHDYRGLPSQAALLDMYRGKLMNKLQLPVSLKQHPLAKSVRSARQKRAFTARLNGLNGQQKAVVAYKPAHTFRAGRPTNAKVMIIGWYGTETLGDKAILGGVIQAIEPHLDNPTFYIASLEKYVTDMTKLQMPELATSEVLSMHNAWDKVGAMDLVVIGGGPLMATPALAELQAFVHSAAGSDVPILIAGCGIGPLNQPFHNDSIKTILTLAAKRVYRDQKSRRMASDLGIDTAMDHVAEDPAFTWLAHTRQRQQRASSGSSTESKPSLLLGLRDWPYFQYAPDMEPSAAKGVKERFEAEIVATLTRLLKQHPTLRIIPFPMCTNHIGGDDRWFYRELFRNHPDILANLDMSYLGAELAPETAVSLFQHASAALTMRYHSLIFALACDVPTVSIDYTMGNGKVYSLAQKYNVPQLRLDEFNHQVAYEMVTAALASSAPDSGFDRQQLNFAEAIQTCIASFYS